MPLADTITGVDWTLHKGGEKMCPVIALGFYVLHLVLDEHRPSTVFYFYTLRLLDPCTTIFLTIEFLATTVGQGLCVPVKFSAADDGERAYHIFSRKGKMIR